MKLRSMLSKSFSIPDVFFFFPFGLLASFDFDSCSALVSPHLTAKVLDKGASSANVLVWSDPHWHSLRPIVAFCACATVLVGMYDVGKSSEGCL